MPMKKTTTTTVKKYKSTRRGKKRSYRKRVPSRVHSFKRLGQTIIVDNAGSTTGTPNLTADGSGSFVMGDWVSSSFTDSYDVGLAGQFKLNSLVDFNDFVDLFDRYKLTGVKLDIMYQQNISSFLDTGSILPTLYYAWDFDDANAPSTSTVVTHKGYCRQKLLNGNKTFSVFLRPRIQKAAVVDPKVGTLAYTSERACWLDTLSNTVPHYGIKMWLANLPKGNPGEPVSLPTCQIRIQPTYYLKAVDTQ